METVKKVSQITVDNLINYLRLTDENVDDNERGFIESLLVIATDYIKNLTSVEDLDLYSDLVIVVYVLVQDMYDNRSLSAESASSNKVVQTILGLHDFNLL